MARRDTGSLAQIYRFGHADEASHALLRCALAGRNGLAPGSRSFENERPVRAAKAKIVFDSYIDFEIAGGVGTVIQVTLWILVENIDGRGALLMVNREHGKY